MRSICRALLVLDVLYCLLALVEDDLPGWKMFESVERQATLVDRSGRAIDARAFLPRDAHVVDVAQAAEIARFICDKDPARAPLTLEDGDGRTLRTIAPAKNGCVIGAR